MTKRSSPHDRIKLLMEEMLEAQAWMQFVWEQAGHELKPETLAKLPKFPTFKYFIEEQARIKFTAKNVLAARHRMRLHRFRKAEGMQPLRGHKEFTEEIKIEQEIEEASVTPTEAIGIEQPAGTVADPFAKKPSNE